MVPDNNLLHCITQHADDVKDRDKTLLIHAGAESIAKSSSNLVLHSAPKPPGLSARPAPSVDVPLRAT